MITVGDRLEELREHPVLELSSRHHGIALLLLLGRNRFPGLFRGGLRTYLLIAKIDPFKKGNVSAVDRDDLAVHDFQGPIQDPFLYNVNSPEYDHFIVDIQNGREKAGTERFFFGRTKTLAEVRLILVQELQLLFKRQFFETAFFISSN